MTSPTPQQSVSTNSDWLSGPFWRHVIGKRLLLVVLPCTLLAAALLAPLPGFGRAWDYTLDLCHAPAFALFTVLICYVAYIRPGKRPRWWELVVVGCMLTAFGAAAEKLQDFTGRNGNWHDATANMIGVIGGLIFSVGWMYGFRLVTRTAVALLVIMIAQVRPLYRLTDVGWQSLQFPTLADFEYSVELTRWRSVNARIWRHKGHASQGEFSMGVRLSGHRYCGMVCRHPVADWTRYDSFHMDVEVVGDDDIHLVVKFEDREHNHEVSDRYNRGFQLSPGRHHIEIPLIEVAMAPSTRRLDLQRMAKIEFFALRGKKGSEYFVDNVRLASGHATSRRDANRRAVAYQRSGNTN